MTISRRHFGLRGAAAAKIKATPLPARPTRPPSWRPSGKQVKYGLTIAAVVFIVCAKLLSVYHFRQVVENAPEHIRKACAGSSLRSFSRDAYYNCILRVEAGGEV